MRRLLSLLVVFPLFSPVISPAHSHVATVTAKYIILMIGDGFGANHLNAANLYTGAVPVYQSWTQYWMTTYAYNGSYDPSQAWSDFYYILTNPTDSAEAATAMYTGVKTENSRISVTQDGFTRLTAITEEAHSLGKAAGAVTSVQISHATPGAWIAHNDNRSNGYAIADEGLWGNPNTTGTPATHSKYNGGHGSTLPPMDVLIGAGHPNWNTEYVTHTQILKLTSENGSPDAFTFMERIAGSIDAGARLLSAADTLTVTRLAGLFGGSAGNLEYRKADGSGQNPENPTLVEMTEAALKVLSRDPDGFILMVEGGAIDKASHSNNMDQMVGEVIDFNNAIQAVIDWVDDPSNDSAWSNTLVIVTADHETGYLTAAPSAYPNQPLGEVSPRTLLLEKTSSSLRASWEDDGDNLIETGEQVYWVWNTPGHTNSLVQLFAKGAGAIKFNYYFAGIDPVRGAYMDNTDVFKVMHAALHGFNNYPVLIPVILK